MMEERNPVAVADRLDASRIRRERQLGNLIDHFLQSARHHRNLNEGRSFPDDAKSVRYMLRRIHDCPRFCDCRFVANLEFHPPFEHLKDFIFSGVYVEGDASAGPTTLLGQGHAATGILRRKDKTHGVPHHFQFDPIFDGHGFCTLVRPLSGHRSGVYRFRQRITYHFSLQKSVPQSCL
jgi:hypothetical protein